MVTPCGMGIIYMHDVRMVYRDPLRHPEVINKRLLKESFVKHSVITNTKWELEDIFVLSLFFVGKIEWMDVIADEQTVV